MPHQDVVIGPMTEEFILWRCLHDGPQSGETIDVWPPDDPLGWSSHRAINLPLLKKLIGVYGTCAILATDGAQVVGFLRFYPRVLFSLQGAGLMCLQQGFPAGPSGHLINQRFPPLDEIRDKTLSVHCLMTGSPFREENPYQRRGIGTRMARELVRWARENGWESIEATANEDIDILYANTGEAGRSFWEKIGLRVVKTENTSRFHGDFLDKMLQHAREQGLDPEKVQFRYTMRLDLT